MIIDLAALSVQNLARRRLRAYLTMIGIFIGIAAVVALIGLGEGLRTAIIGQFGFLGTDVLSVQAQGVFGGPPGTAVATPLHEDLVDEINGVRGVDIAFGRLIDQGEIAYDDIYGAALFASIPGGEARDVFERMTDLETQKGRLLKDGDNDKMLIGDAYLQSEDNEDGMRIGDQVEVEGDKFEVVGAVEQKGSFLFDNVIFMNEEAMRDAFGDDETVNIIAVKVQDIDEMGDVKADIEDLLRDERDVDEGEEDFVVETPQSTLDSLNQILFAVQLFVTIIALISLVVGGIGITNTMYTAVLERTKEIGIMKSLGARNSSVFTIFLFESGFLGMVGGLVGVAIGASLAYGMAYLGRVQLGSDLIQAHITMPLVVGALLFSLLVGLMAGVVPAYQAAKKHPVDALRFST